MFISGKLKQALIPVKNAVINKYSSLRYASAHREFTCLKSESKKTRYNLILPYIDESLVFGGIATAIELFYRFIADENCDRRIISLNRYKKITPKIDVKELEIKIIDISDDSLDVRENDIFMATFWTTALVAEKAMEFQRKEFHCYKTLLYLIQDFEPGFYPWSSDYAEAERTYKLPYRTLAVFNSKELYTYMKENGYSFYKELYFTPKLNSELAKFLFDKKDSYKRKKQIIIYGRPQEYRNGYTLIIDALRKFSVLIAENEATKWKIFSLGTDIKNVKLSQGLTVVSKGKLSLEDYAKIMLESYVGISLMISPHPSYPPLEMSTFGVRTITNSFKVKNLSNFNKNIISLDVYDANSIATTLYNVVKEYDVYESNIDCNPSYIDNKNESIEKLATDVIKVLHDDLVQNEEVK